MNLCSEIRGISDRGDARLSTWLHRITVNTSWTQSSLEGDLAIARSWKAPVAVAAALLSMAAAVIIWRMRPNTSS